MITTTILNRWLIPTEWTQAVEVAAKREEKRLRKLMEKLQRWLAVVLEEVGQPSSHCRVVLTWWARERLWLFTSLSTCIFNRQLRCKTITQLHELMSSIQVQNSKSLPLSLRRVQRALSLLEPLPLLLDDLKHEKINGRNSIFKFVRCP